MKYGINFLKKNWKYFPKSLYVLIFLVLSLLIGGYFFHLWTEDNIAKIYSGLIVATVITLLNVIFDFKNFQFSKLIYQSALSDIFVNRHELEKYVPLIRKAKKEIKIMGVSASRFLEDNGKCERRDTLDQLLDNGISIQILITTPENQLKATTKSLIQKYQDHRNFEIKHFDQNIYIQQSIFVVDDICALGPIFTGVESKHTPTLLFNDKHSIYARQFMTYFDQVWNHRDTIEIRITNE